MAFTSLTKAKISPTAAGALKSSSMEAVKLSRRAATRSFSAEASSTATSSALASAMPPTASSPVGWPASSSQSRAFTAFSIRVSAASASATRCSPNTSGLR